MEIILQEVSASEKENFVDFLTIYWEEIDPNFDFLKIYLDRYAESLFNNKNRILKWVLLKKQAIGFVIYYFYNSNLEKKGIHIAEFFIKKEFRGKGYAKETLDLIKSVNPGIFELRLEVLKTNKRANQFWRQNGFDTWKYILKKIL